MDIQDLLKYSSWIESEATTFWAMLPTFIVTRSSLRVLCFAQLRGPVQSREPCLASRPSSLAVAKGEPFRFTAPETDIEFVVLRADVYDR